MASVFDTIKQKAGDTDKSATWYRTQVNKIASGTTAGQLFRQGKLNGRPSVGRLNLFGYNPKFRKTLPYYDIFPLVLPLEPISGGFMGMNFHYLPPLLRFRLLERMQATATDQRFDSKTKFDVTYADIKNVRIVKPTIKDGQQVRHVIREKDLKGHLVNIDAEKAGVSDEIVPITTEENEDIQLRSAINLLKKECY